MKTLGDYIWNTTNRYGFSIGWDMKDTKFSSSNYILDIFNDFALNLRKKARQTYII